MGDVPAKAEELYFQAIDHYAEGRAEEAIAAYQAALALHPEYTDAMHGLTRAFQDQQRYDEAIAVASRITSVDPEDVLAHTSLSILYQNKGMVPEAEAEANKARILGWKHQLRAQKEEQK